MYFSLLSRDLYIPSQVKLDCCIRHKCCIHFRWTTPLQLVTCFYKISFSTRAALTVILDVPGHAVCSTISDLPATFSDILPSRYAVFLRRDRLTVNFVGGKPFFHWKRMTLRTSSWDQVFSPVAITNRLILWTLYDSFLRSLLHFTRTTSDTSYRKIKSCISTNVMAYLFLAWQPPVCQGLIQEVSSSHTHNDAP